MALSPILQAFIGTLFTYGMTALGAAVVFLMPTRISYHSQRKVLDASLGFAAGVMIAASAFGLLIPAMTFAEESELYGSHSWAPAVIGTLLGGGFVTLADLMIPHEAADAVTVLTGTGTGTGRGVGHQHEGSEKEDEKEQDVEAAKPVPLPSKHDRDAIDGENRSATVKLHVNQESDQPATAMMEMRERSDRKSEEPDRVNIAVGAGGPVTSIDKDNSNSISISSDETKQQSGSDHDHDRDVPNPAHDHAASDSIVPASPVESTRNSVSVAPVVAVGVVPPAAAAESEVVDPRTGQTAAEQWQSWRRIILLVIAIVIHNFPEGLAVGVAFGALSTTDHTPASHSPADLEEARRLSQVDYDSTFNDARTLALGIGLQNFPEGLAVSLPLMRVGYSRTRAFMWGQLSGMVEPIGGVLGAGIIHYMKPILPYALSFAAGAMVMVVVSDLIPESHAKGGYPKLAAWFFMFGFSLMMAMDVALG